MPRFFSSWSRTELTTRPWFGAFGVSRQCGDKTQFFCAATRLSPDYGTGKHASRGTRSECLFGFLVTHRCLSRPCSGQTNRSLTTSTVPCWYCFASPHVTNGAPRASSAIRWFALSSAKQMITRVRLSCRPKMPALHACGAVVRVTPWQVVSPWQQWYIISSLIFLYLIVIQVRTTALTLAHTRREMDGSTASRLRFWRFL